MKNKVCHSIKESLGKNHACYVLITCDEPNEDGQMAVEMTYEGDAGLASYLIRGAQEIIDDQFVDENS